ADDRGVGREVELDLRRGGVVLLVGDAHLDHGVGAAALRLVGVERHVGRGRHGGGDEQRARGHERPRRRAGHHRRPPDHPSTHVVLPPFVRGDSRPGPPRSSRGRHTPAGSARAGFGVRAGRPTTGSSLRRWGRRTVATTPPLRGSRRLTSPPSVRASNRARYRPIPVPCTPSLPGPRRKGANSSSAAAPPRPGPWSATAIDRLRSVVRAVTRTGAAPYFAALSTRLEMMAR